jgi:flagellin-like protein
MMKKIWAMKKKDDAVSPVIATILMVAITVVLAAVLYVMVLGLGSTGSITPTIGTNKGSTATATTWTVTAISGGASILKTDVYVQVKDATGTFKLSTIALATASATQGFNYTSASAGTFISVGDVFSLVKIYSNAYTQGSTLTLVTAGATGQYCVLTV